MSDKEVNPKDGNYIPVDDLPEQDRDDLSSYSESERPGVSADPNG